MKTKGTYIHVNFEMAKTLRSNLQRDNALKKKNFDNKKNV